MADLGGSILTGIDGNQLAVLARQLRIPMHDTDLKHVPLYTPDGSEADAQIDKRVRGRGLPRGLQGFEWSSLRLTELCHRAPIVPFFDTACRSSHDCVLYHFWALILGGL